MRLNANYEAAWTTSDRHYEAEVFNRRPSVTAYSVTDDVGWVSIKGGPDGRPATQDGLVLANANRQDRGGAYLVDPATGEVGSRGSIGLTVDDRPWLVSRVRDLLAVHAASAIVRFGP